MQTEDYIQKSLELHLFFGRIMKEHALILRAGFTPANMAFSSQAEMYKSGIFVRLDYERYRVFLESDHDGTCHVHPWAVRSCRNRTL